MSAGPHIISRLIALFILLSACLLIWIALLRPAHDWRADAFANLTDHQTEFTRLRASSSRLETERTRLSEDASLEIIWKAKRLGEATAMVQSEISNLAANHGVELRSITPVPSREIPFVIAIGFRVEGEATVDKLTSFLIELETSSPALIIERSVLRRLVRPGRTTAQPNVFVQLSLIAPVLLAEEEET